MARRGTMDCIPKLIDKVVGLLLGDIPLKYSERGIPLRRGWLTCEWRLEPLL
jgi:hypothetical protein